MNEISLALTLPSLIFKKIQIEPITSIGGCHMKGLCFDFKTILNFILDLVVIEV